MYKSNDQINVNGLEITVGINNVLIFHYDSANIEFWIDNEEVYHVGIAYIRDGEETKYRHQLLGEEPKKWNEKAMQAKEIYEALYPQVSFTNYM